MSYLILFWGIILIQSGMLVDKTGSYIVKCTIYRRCASCHDCPKADGQLVTLDDKYVHCSVETTVCSDCGSLYCYTIYGYLNGKWMVIRGHGGTDQTYGENPYKDWGKVYHCNSDYCNEKHYPDPTPPEAEENSKGENLIGVNSTASRLGGKFGNLFFTTSYYTQAFYWISIIIIIISAI